VLVHICNLYVVYAVFRDGTHVLPPRIFASATWEVAKTTQCTAFSLQQLAKSPALMSDLNKIPRHSFPVQSKGIWYTNDSSRRADNFRMQHSTVCTIERKHAHLGRGGHWMTTTPELTTSLLHISFLLVPRLLDFRFYFQTAPHFPSFQMGIVIVSGIHKKWTVLEWFYSNAQIIGSVRFSTSVVHCGSAFEPGASRLIDWCCFYYLVRNSLAALLKALCARICFWDSWISGFFWHFFFCGCVQGL